MSGSPEQPAHRSAGPVRLRPLPRFAGRLARLWWLLRTLVRSGMLAPLRPDKYVRMGLAVRRYGVGPTLGLSLAAARRPNGVGLIDERGSITWGELELGTSALAAALASLPGGRPTTVAILCRNHRGFVEALAATAKLGADALLLNTGFSAPQLGDVLVGEGADLLIYDEEFAGIVRTAKARSPHLREILAWTDQPTAISPAAPPAAPTTAPTLDSLISSPHSAATPRLWPRSGGSRGVSRRSGATAGLWPRSGGSRGVSRRREATTRRGRVVLLTSGTTGAPKGARRSGGGVGTLAAVLDRIPWRAEETTVVAAPMFHAWGFGQLIISATMTCTVVMRRRFEPEATLDLVERHGATGLSVVPVMLERIVDLPAETLARYQLPTLRFASASGSRMRPDAVTRFMDRFGDVVFNSYNATEAGMITIATPADLRVAADTAGRPATGVDLRVVDEDWRPLPAGAVGRIIVRSDSQFDGYTSGGAKDFHEGYMVTGDVGRVDAAGRLYVVGRDDEMIVSGGENVYPLEVEQALGSHDAVREVAVIGVDDVDFGQRLAAFVVPASAASVTADDLKRYVKERLAGYKVPRDVMLLDELPRNASGKVVKRELVELV